MSYTNKATSRLGKDLERALFICKLRDHLAELVDNMPNVNARQHVLIQHSYVQAAALLACAVVDMGQEHAGVPKGTPPAPVTISPAESRWEK
jgi:hypothetical protein